MTMTEDMIRGDLPLTDVPPDMLEAVDLLGEFIHDQLRHKVGRATAVNALVFSAMLLAADARREALAEWLRGVAHAVEHDLKSVPAIGPGTLWPDADLH